MAPIKYTSIINSFVSTEGSAGFMTNYIYYSVLVVYVDGTADIIEGKTNEIKPLLRFLQTPQDAVEKLADQISNLTNTIRSFDRNKSTNQITDTIRAEVDYLIDSIYPIPNIIGKTIDEATIALKESGFEPIIDNPRVKETRDGIIHSVKRNKNNFKVVNISCEYDLPDVEGLPMEEALTKLELAGFVPNINYIKSEKEKVGIVINCHRNSDHYTEADLDIGITTDSRLRDFMYGIKEMNKISKVLNLWKELGLEGEQEYREIEEDINRQYEIEKFYGPSRSPERIEKLIQKLETVLQ